MVQMAESVALYWDFENLHAGLVDETEGPGSYAANRFRPQNEIIDVATIIEFALSVGPLAINRAFANWVSFSRYRVALLQSAIELIQVFPPGANAKNGADIKLCLDVLDDMTRFSHISTIIVVGGDSDYMPLSYKVKAAGRTLIGIGNKGSTNQHWARSCHEFKMYETLLGPMQRAALKESVSECVAAVDSVLTLTDSSATSLNGTASFCPPEEVKELRELLAVAVDETTQRKAARDLVSKAINRLGQTRGDTWIQKARLRPFIQRMDPTFHESSLGFKTFNEMIASMGDIIEIRKGEFDHELRLR